MLEQRGLELYQGVELLVDFEHLTLVVHQTLDVIELGRNLLKRACLFVSVRSS